LGDISYQWSAGGVAITGVTSSTYVLTQGEVGKAITVAASYTDGYWYVESKASSATTAVANTNDLPTGAVTITGTATQGQTLTAANTLADLDGLGDISYQWSAGGVAITGATASTYVLTESEVGKTLTVKASYTDGFGAPESKASSATTAVANVNDATTGSKTVELLAYSWKAHTLLSEVRISSANTARSGITDAIGTTSFTSVTDASLSLTATRTVPDEEATSTSAAVNLQDAIAILKMIVGLPVNGSNQALSPYQALAADYDGNGRVELADAIGVLKHVVGLSAPDPTWHFLNEIDASVPGKANLTPGLPQTTVAADLSGLRPVHVGLVGYLSGDVDGSFSGASGASDLDQTQPGYIAALVGLHAELSLAQFGM
jgi:hypothetical protein